MVPDSQRDDLAPGPVESNGIEFKRTLKSVVNLGSGEFLARACSVLVVILLGHKYGVVIVGAYSLAQGMTQYLLVFIDFGLRHVGARLIARFPASAATIVRRVQRRRLLMAAATIPFLIAYAAVARFPRDQQIFLFVFALGGTMYALSLDWAAWGREKLRLVGFSKAAASGSILLFLFIAMAGWHLLGWLAVGNMVGYCLQAAIVWVWWRNRRPLAESEQDAPTIEDALRWGRTSIVGLAWVGNMAFNTSDMLVLGAMSDPRQVGLYSASYRILNQILVTYYLLTYALFPQFARLQGIERRRMLRGRIFLGLFAAGAALTVLIGVFREPLLTIIFGRSFLLAGPLLFVLAWTVPLDFMVSYLSNAYLAWSMERSVVISAAIATCVNITLNISTIPRYGAMAAAVNTLLSYIVYFVALLWSGRRHQGLAAVPLGAADGT